MIKLKETNNNFNAEVELKRTSQVGKFVGDVKIYEGTSLISESWGEHLWNDFYEDYGIIIYDNEDDFNEYYNVNANGDVVKLTDLLKEKL